MRAFLHARKCSHRDQNENKMEGISPVELAVKAAVEGVLEGLIPAFGRSDSVLKAGAGVIHF